MKPSRYVIVLLGLAVFGAPAGAQPGFDEVVKKVSATFEPATAKPGQTVTFKLSVQLLDGWYTYPTVQPDKAAKTYVNKLSFPVAGDLVFVGDFDDPPNAKEKAEPLLNIEKMLVYPGGATWERKAVILPTTKPGAVTSKLKFRVLVCDKSTCLPYRDLVLEAALKVAGDPVPVDPKYKAEVEKALKKSP